MKAIFVSLFGVFAVTAIITHIWTVIIAFTKGGFFGGVLTLFLPFLGELYWMFKMFGENDTYAYIALTHLILAIPFSMFGRSDRKKATHYCTFTQKAGLRVPKTV